MASCDVDIFVIVSLIQKNIWQKDIFWFGKEEDDYNSLRCYVFFCNLCL